MFQVSTPVKQSMTLKTDADKVRELRDYFRRNFLHGDNDEFFLAWVKTVLKDLRQVEGQS